MGFGREAIIKAAVAAMRPTGLNWSSYHKERVSSDLQANDNAAPIAPKELVGALSFAAVHVITPETRQKAGVWRVDPLPALLWRVKWGAERRPEYVHHAALLLLRRMKGRRVEKPSATKQALVIVALTEWIDDQCPSCRRPGPQRGATIPCTNRCRNGRVRRHPGHPRFGDHGDPVNLDLCPVCHGKGRIFGERPKGEGEGRWCSQCVGGTRALTVLQRGMIVGAVLRDYWANRGDDKATVMDPSTFETKWAKRYDQVLDRLRGIDRELAKAVDRQMRRAQNRATESGQEQDELPDDESDVNSDSGGRVAAANR